MASFHLWPICVIIKPVIPLEVTYELLPKANTYLRRQLQLFGQKQENVPPLLPFLGFVNKGNC